jgi:hypothetical protein
MLPTPGTTNQRNHFEMNACFVLSVCNSNNVSNTLHLTILRLTKPALSVQYWTNVFENLQNS